MWLIVLFACGADAPVPTPPAEPPRVVEAPAPAPPPPAGPGKIGGKPILRDPIVLGGISVEAVHAGIAAVRPALESCWQAQPEPRARGRVAVRFTIDGSGVAHSARVHSTSLRSPDAEACVLQVIDTATFPPLEGSGVAIVTYPLAFGVDG